MKTTMLLKHVPALFLAFAIPNAAPAQEAGSPNGGDAKTLLENTAKAMGAQNLGSIHYSGSGFHYALGQSPSPGAPWPKFNLKAFDRTVDFDNGSAKQTMTRTQAENPPHGGGNQPIIGEQTQTSASTTRSPWPDQFEMWLTPAGFLKAAAAPSASVRTKTVAGKSSSAVTISVDKKHSLTAYINDQSLIDRIETKVENPVLGDMAVDATFSDYKDFHGLRFPTRIVENQGGFPILEITVSDANKNVMTGLAAPKDADTSAPPRPIIDEELVAPDVYYFTGGTHHSVIVGFNDYVVVIEAPQDEARSAAVISEVKKVFINKPIRYLVNTHQHFDHSGGVRTYAAEGATILTMADNKAWYEKVWATPRTLSPDKLSESKKKLAIEAVPEKKVLTDGTHVIELYHVPSGHNSSMLLAYLPKDRILIEADLFTPVAADAKPVLPPSPYTTALADKLDSLKLEFDTILALHGRRVTRADLNLALGKGK